MKRETKYQIITAENNVIRIIISNRKLKLQRRIASVGYEVIETKEVIKQMTQTNIKGIQQQSKLNEERDLLGILAETEIASY